MSISKNRLLEEKYIDILVSIHEGTITEDQLHGFEKAMDIFVDKQVKSAIITRATTRANEFIANLN